MPINHAARKKSGPNFKWKNFFHLKFIFEAPRNGCNLSESSCLLSSFIAQKILCTFSRSSKDFQNWFNRHLSLGLAFKILLRNSSKSREGFWDDGDLGDECANKELVIFHILMLLGKWMFGSFCLNNLCSNFTFQRDIHHPQPSHRSTVVEVLTKYFWWIYSWSINIEFQEWRRRADRWPEIELISLFTVLGKHNSNTRKT